MSHTLPFLLILAAAAVGGITVSSARAGDSPAPGASAPAAPIDLQNTKCPVTGQPVAPGVTDVVDGVVVHFCCTKCPAKYRANPRAYEAALRSEPAVASRLDEVRNSVAHVSAPSPTAGSVAAPVANSKGLVFHDAMRQLWGDHVAWTRLFIISALGNLPDKEAATNRLLKNQEEIGNALKPIYGDEAGSKLTALLKDHILIAADLVTASAANDSAKAEAAKVKWFANADEIAAFLNGANPAWSLDAARSMLHEHLDATTAEATARIQKNWDADIVAYDSVQRQAMSMADMLSDGIRSQFPQKFE